MSYQEGVDRSLELCAERDIDISARVYEIFFARCPEAVDLMGHSDDLMRGRMMEQVFKLLLEEENDQEYLNWEIYNHIIGYQVDKSMYADFFVAVKDAIKTELGDAWTDAQAKAWDGKIAQLTKGIDLAEANAEANF